MNKYIKDKTIALLGAGLLGYYLALSIFRGPIWDGMLQVLPAINNRHLPQFYIGIMGAVMLAVLGYLLFTVFIEKKSFQAHKRQYLVTLSLLVIAPLFVAGIFRFHAVSFVKNSENTTPTSIRISNNAPGSEIMFENDPSSASGIRKSIVITGNDVEHVGKMIRDLKLKEVVKNHNRLENPQGTLWVDYRIDGKWYSKIVNFGQGIFEEEVAQGSAHYQNQELTKFLEEAITESKDIKQYKKAELINSQSMESKEKRTILSDEDFEKLLDLLTVENKIEPSPEILKRLQVLDKNWVKKTETDIYAIHLLTDNSGHRQTENFMVYDNLTKTLMFENEYYRVDLTEKFIP